MPSFKYQRPSKAILTELEHPLSTRLKEIGQKLPYIGYGGCGHFAIALHEKLDRSEIWVIASVDIDVNDPDWSKYSFGPIAHATCWHDGFFLDSNGSHRRLCRTEHGLSESCKKFYRKVNSSIMREWLKFDSHWNSFFNRSDLPLMRELVNQAVPIRRVA